MLRLRESVVEARPSHPELQGRHGKTVSLAWFIETVNVTKLLKDLYLNLVALFYLQHYQTSQQRILFLTCNALQCKV